MNYFIIQYYKNYLRYHSIQKMNSKKKNSKNIIIHTTFTLLLPTTSSDYSDNESDYDDEIDYENYIGSTKNRVVRNHGNYYRGPIGKVRMAKGGK